MRAWCRTLLLACASCKETCAWVSGCAPARKIALTHEAFASGGIAEAHGALWPLVLSLGKSTPKPEAADAAQLCALLAAAASIDRIAHLHAALQLAALVHRAAHCRLPWPSEVRFRCCAGCAEGRWNMIGNGKWIFHI